MVHVMSVFFRMLRKPDKTKAPMAHVFAYPRHPQSPKWKEFLHKVLVEGLGCVPRGMKENSYTYIYIYIFFFPDNPVLKTGITPIESYSGNCIGTLNPILGIYLDS